MAGSSAPNLRIAVRGGLDTCDVVALTKDDSAGLERQRSVRFAPLGRFSGVWFATINPSWVWLTPTRASRRVLSLFGTWP
jgi:hypothetical protein